jgi:hypothetical protein
VKRDQIVATLSILEMAGKAATPRDNIGGVLDPEERRAVAKEDPNALLIMDVCIDAWSRTPGAANGISALGCAPELYFAMKSDRGAEWLG